MTTTFEHARAWLHLLTPTERRTTADAAADLSRAEIGSRRFISPRTVDDLLGKASYKLQLPVKDLKRFFVLAGLAALDVPGIDPTWTRPDRRSVITTRRDGVVFPAQHEKAGVLLGSLGHPHHQIHRRWREPGGRVEVEPGWEVLDLPDWLAVALSLAYGQRSVLTNGVLYHLPPTGTHLEAQLVKEVVAVRPGDNADQTVEPDGTAWYAVLEPTTLRLPFPRAG